MTRFVLTLAAAAAVLSGCGGGGASATKDPASAVPVAGGLRAHIRAAANPKPSDFPAPAGKSLEQLAAASASGPELAMASSQLDAGRSRVAFGMIDAQGQPVYGTTALYVARTPSSRARGPFLAPADVLLTAPRFLS